MNMGMGIQGKRGGERREGRGEERGEERVTQGINGNMERKLG